MENCYPFPFLDAYQSRHRDFFFGRDEEIDALYQLTQQTNIALVYGTSGSGKTSIVRCGLSKKFKSYDWLELYVRRGKHLISSLDQLLCEESDGRFVWQETAPGVPGDLREKIEAVYRASFKPLYLIFDQFEELYILGDKEEQKAFVQIVLQILQMNLPVKVIICIREEYLGHLFDFERQVPELFRKKLRVEPMSQDNITNVLLGVDKPEHSLVHLQKDKGEEISKEIFSLLKGETARRDVDLPYFQVLLDRLYLQITGDDTRSSPCVFTLEALRQLPRLDDLLRDFLYEQVRQTAGDLQRPEEELWRVLSEFVTLEGTKEPLTLPELERRLADLPAEFLKSAVQALETRRILRNDERDQRYEVAHDTLALQINARRSEDEIARLVIMRLVKSQVAMRPEERDFFTEKQLGTIEPLLEKLSLTKEELDWIERSRKYIDRKKAEAQRNHIEQLNKERSLREKAEAAKAELEKALVDIRARNLVTFRSFAELGANLIYTLDHAEALEKLKTAAATEVEEAAKREALFSPLSELLFFFAEGGRRPELAVEAAALLLGLQPDAALAAQLECCVVEKWNTREQFAPLLTLLPEFSTLQTRYYPVTVEVPTGSDGVFEMGSEGSEWFHQPNEQLHKVKLSPYRMAVTETTFYQFSLFSEATGRGLASRTPYWGRFGDHPVVNVNWYEATEYSNWLNAQQGYPVCYSILKEIGSDPNNHRQSDLLKWKVDWNLQLRGYRLPTEAEWELAARGGVGANRSLFSGNNNLDDFGWYWENSGDAPLSGNWGFSRVYDNNCRTHPVGMKQANTIGLYDMSGNAWEWCWDWYESGYYGECNEQGIVDDPIGPQSSSEGRVLRGGSWCDETWRCRSVYRFRRNPAMRDYDDGGFRLVLLP